MKELLRLDEVAKILKISKKTAHRLINDIENPLPSVKVLGSFRVKASDLEHYIKKNKHKPWE